MDPRPATRHPSPPRARGGRRPGAGAPKGNTNALKTGRYSTRVIALRGALEAVPRTAQLIPRLTANDRRKMETLGHALHIYADILLLVARGGSIKDLDDPQIRSRVIYGIPIKQSTDAQGDSEDARRS